MPSPNLPPSSGRPRRRPRLTPHFELRHTGEYLLRGILVVAPILLTVSLVYWLFKKLDGMLHPYVIEPGLGFLILILVVLFIGWASTFYVIKRSLRVVGHGIEITPGISFIYTSIRDFFEAFVGDKRRFTQAVLVSVTMDEVWVVGFLTDESPSTFDLEEGYVSVYVPQAYNVAGQLYIVKRERIRLIDRLAPSDMMKYAVTGGAVVISEK